MITLVQTVVDRETWWHWECFVCGGFGPTTPVGPGAVAIVAVFHVGSHTPPPAPGGMAALSPKESDTLRMLATGMTPDEIANARYVSILTVRTQVQAVLRKTGARHVPHAVAIAWSSGWMWRHS